METIKTIFEHANDIVGAVALILTGVITISVLLPGKEPENTLQKIVDFIGKFSRK
ncbi:hypothetical protein [Caudoviricetes sp.]|nr:hypothetical protein [Caudoviricetes sp.]